MRKSRNMRTSARRRQAALDVETLEEAIMNADIDLVIGKWNEYCSDNNDESYVYEKDDDVLNEQLKEMEPMDAYRTISNGNYSESDKYFYYNGYANICTFSSLSDPNCPVDDNAMAKWIIENDDYDFIEELGLEADEDDDEL